MTKTVTYQCDICKVEGRGESAVIGIQTNRTDGKKYVASPQQCHNHICQRCADAITRDTNNKLTELQSQYERLLSRWADIQHWYETADRSAHSWAELDKIMENQDD